MSGAVLRRGSGPVADQVLRVLTCECRISTNCRRMEESLRYIVPDARHSFPEDHRFAYHVQADGDRYSLREGTQVLGTGLSGAETLTRLFNHIHERTMLAMPDWSWIHAGCGSRNNRRFLVVGGKYAGKSTLMAALVLAGVEVFGDESVMLRGGTVVPVARKFYVREGSLHLLPGLAAIVERLPFVRDDVDGRVVAFDPREAGLEWRISPASVDVIFALAPHHGRPTRLEPCPKYRMAEHVMRQSHAAISGAGRWVGDVCAMVDGADTYDLHIGDLEQALAAVIAVLDGHDGSGSAPTRGDTPRQVAGLR